MLSWQSTLLQCYFDRITNNYNSSFKVSKCSLVLFCNSQSIIVKFFAYQADWRALRGALIGCLALLRRKSDAGMVSSIDAKAAAESYLKNLQVQSLGQHDRKVGKCAAILSNLKKEKKALTCF